MQEAHVKQIENSDSLKFLEILTLTGRSVLISKNMMVLKSKFMSGVPFRLKRFIHTILKKYMLNKISLIF